MMGSRYLEQSYDDALRENIALRAEIEAVTDAIGSSEWMDLPDGGDVSLAEQVRRMKDDLATARANEAYFRSALNRLWGHKIDV